MSNSSWFQPQTTLTGPKTAAAHMIDGDELLRRKDRMYQGRVDGAKDVQAFCMRQEPTCPGDGLQAQAFEIGVAAIAAPAPDRHIRSMPAASAICASLRLSSQVPDQRSGTFVAARPEEQLLPNSPSFSLLRLKLLMRLGSGGFACRTKRRSPLRQQRREPFGTQISIPQAGGTEGDAERSGSPGDIQEEILLDQGGDRRDGDGDRQECLRYIELIVAEIEPVIFRFEGFRLDHRLLGGDLDIFAMSDSYSAACFAAEGLINAGDRFEHAQMR